MYRRAWRTSGFEVRQALEPAAPNYDTSEPARRDPQAETELMGDGDVRFWCRRRRAERRNAHPLPDPPDGKGSL